MDSKTLSRSAGALSAQVENAIQKTELGAAATAAVKLKGQLALEANASIPLEEIERAVETILTSMEAFEKKVKKAEDSGKPTFADAFKGKMPPVPPSREIARLRKRLSDAFLAYRKARA